MDDFPRFNQSQYICNVGFKVEPKVKDALQRMRMEGINVGKWIREIVVRELEKRGRINETSRLNEVHLP